MILVNIDSLSLSELKNIAQEEGINIDDLTRDEIISELRDKYADESDTDSAIGEDSNLRYLSGITDYREINEYVAALPGVEQLPESYPDTEIHLMLKSSSWAYCYWQLSQMDSDRIANASGSLFLAVSIIRSGAEELYDIPVSLSDDEWNIGIPYGDGSASVSLVSAAGNIGKAFTFEGFLSPKPGRRKERLSELFSRGDAFIIYESPFRVVKTLGDIAATGPARLVIGRELTKAHEEIIAGSVEDVLSDLSSRESIKGEFAILVVPEER